MGKKTQMIGDVPGQTLGMLADLCHKLKDGTLAPEELDLFLKRQNPFLQPEEIIAEWRVFWQKFGLKPDFSQVRLPKRAKGFDRVLIIPKGLTLNQAIQFCKDRFPVSSCWDDLNNAITINDRAPAKTYAARLRDRREPDEELKNLSADVLAEKKIAGNTLLEGLVFELKYFDETRDHLNKTNWNLCSGSRGAVGVVPSLRWDGGRLRVGWCNPGSADGFLRARAVVS